MSYHILPKKQIINKIDPTFNTIEPVISFSLIHYLNSYQEQIKKIKLQMEENKNNDYNIELLYKIINPYEFLHSKVTGSKFSVSKINSNSMIFYTFMEICIIFNIFESFHGRNIKTLHCGHNNMSTIECMNIFRENNNDINYDYFFDNDEIKTNSYIELFPEEKTIDLLYFEVTNIDDSQNNEINSKYILSLIIILCNIYRYQNMNGTCIIKIDSLFYKPIIDIIYILTSIYDKVYIIKPNTSNIFNNERFLICKNFITDFSKTLENNNSLKILKVVLDECINKKKMLSSLIKNDLPYYFMNKIEESNVIIGNQQLEHYDLLINIIKNRNRDDKLETIKKNNIQKCIQWCDKYKIPYNKFVEKLNIFLPVLIYDDIEIE